MTESKDDLAAAPEPDGAPAPEYLPDSDVTLAGEGGPDGASASDDDPEGLPDAPTSATRRRLRAAVALTLVAAIIVFGALGGARLAGIPSETPSPTPHPARLVAVDATGALATMDGDGGSVVPYPAPGVQFGFPAWSPDGTHIAATGLGGGSGTIHVFAVPPSGATGATATPAATVPGGSADAAADDPGVIYRSSDAQPFYLYWTPDSRQVGFLTQEANGISLRIAPADGRSIGTGSTRVGCLPTSAGADSTRLSARSASMAGQMTPRSSRPTHRLRRGPRRHPGPRFRPACFDRPP